MVAPEEAVSYTHLDVYKRQCQVHTHFFFRVGCAIFLSLLFYDKETFPQVDMAVSYTHLPGSLALRKPDPVSYTHLDVYKRQFQYLQLFYSAGLQIP